MDIEELLTSVHLEDVRCIESNAGLALDANVGLSDWAVAEPKGELKLDVRPVSWGARIETWFRLSLEEDFARVVVAYSIIYQREEAVPIPYDVRQDFLERVAFMAVYPYLREAVNRLTAELRLGSVVLPMIRQGEISIELPDEAMAADVRSE